MPWKLHWENEVISISTNYSVVRQGNLFSFPRCSLSSPRVKGTNKWAESQIYLSFSDCNATLCTFRSESERTFSTCRKGSANRAECKKAACLHHSLAHAAAQGSLLDDLLRGQRAIQLRSQHIAPYARVVLVLAKLQQFLYCFSLSLP